MEVSRVSDVDRDSKAHEDPCIWGEMELMGSKDDKGKKEPDEEPCRDLCLNEGGDCPSIDYDACRWLCKEHDKKGDKDG